MNISNGRDGALSCAGQLRSEDWWLRQGSRVPVIPPEPVLRHVLTDIFSPSDAARRRSAGAVSAETIDGLQSEAFSIPRTAPHDSLLARRVTPAVFVTQGGIVLLAATILLSLGQNDQDKIPLACQVDFEQQRQHPRGMLWQVGAACPCVRQCAGDCAAVDPLRARAPVRALGDALTAATHAGCESAAAATRFMHGRPVSSKTT